MAGGGARVADGFADQILGLLNLLPSGDPELLLAGDFARSNVELAALVPARKPAQFARGADFGSSREQRIERHIAIIERLVARFEPIFIEDLAVCSYNVGDKNRVDSRRNRQLLKVGRDGVDGDGED